MKPSTWIHTIISFGILNAGLWIYHDLRSQEKPNYHKSFSWNRKSLISSHAVCIVGNSESLEKAVNVHNMWSRRFPSFWYIWKILPVSNTDIANLHFKFGDLAFNRGLEEMVEFALRSQYECRWFFTHDDDLVFHFSPIYLALFHGVNEDIGSHLISVLSEYDPAVAGFPWDGNNHASLVEHRKVYSRSVVSPLTGFDNGMVIYRRDILDLAVPFRPQGEGGFYGNWTLGAQYLNMVLPWTFRESAICIHSLNYSNTINLDKSKTKNPNNTIKITWETNELVMVEGSRHPYEYKRNAQYVHFLRSGLKCLNCTVFGKDLSPSDLDWRPARALMYFSPRELLHRLATFYDLNHPAVAHTRLVEHNLDLASETFAATPYTLIIFVFTYNRPESFWRLWADLQRLELPIAHAEGTLRLRFVIQKDLSCDVADYIPDDLTSTLGPVQVLRAKVRRGLLRQMIDAWEPFERDSFAMFLEDDVRVSPATLLYVHGMLRRWFYDVRLWDERVAGLSLYNQVFNEVRNSPTSFAADGRPVLWAMPQTWGAVWASRFWKAFRRWYANMARLLPESQFWIEASFTNRWPASSSYKKALLRFMRMHGFGLIYPNFAGAWTLTDVGNASAGDGPSMHVGNHAMQPSEYVARPLQDLISVFDVRHLEVGCDGGEDSF
jgi:hypothetical protein